MELTKEQFKDYRNCQMLGWYNMFNYASYKRDGATKLTKEQWIEAMKNYNKYSRKYGL